MARRICRSSSKLTRRIALIFLAAFVGLQLLDVLSAVEVFSWPEELLRGSIGHALQTGLRAPLLDYMPDGYSLGALSEAVLASLSFRIFGASLFALKLVPIALSTLTLALTLFFLKRHFGDKAALIGAVTYILAPPGYCRLALCALGYQTDAALFSVIILIAFYELLYRPQGRERGLALLFGTASGLGVSYTYITGITILPCLVSWRIQGRRSFVPKNIGFFSLGLLAGLLPMLAHNVATGFEGLKRILYFFSTSTSVGYETWPARIAHFPLKALKLAVASAPSSALFNDVGPLPSRALCCVYALCCLCVLAPAYWPRIASRKLFAAQDRALPILLYLGIFILVYAASDFPTVIGRGDTTIEYRYFAPFWFFVILALTTGVASIQRTSRVLFTGFAGLLALGGIAHARLLFTSPFGRALAYKGYSDAMTGDFWSDRMSVRLSGPERAARFIELLKPLRQPESTYLCWHQFENVEALTAIYGERTSNRHMLDALPAPCRIQSLEIWGYSLGWKTRDSFAQKESGLTHLAAKDRMIAERGLVGGMAINFIHHSDLDLTELKRRMRTRTDLQKEFFRNWGRAADLVVSSYVDRNHGSRILAFAQNLDAQERHWLWHGIGEEVGGAYLWYGLTSSLLRDALALTPTENRGDLAEGMGYHIANVLVDDPTRARDWIDGLGEPLTQAARQGVAEFEARYELSTSR